MNNTSATSKRILSREQVADIVSQRFQGRVLSSEMDRNHLVIRAEAENLFELAKDLKDDADLKMDFLVSVTAVDWLDRKDQRFEVVYHLMSLQSYARIRIKVWLAEPKPEIDSLCPLWQSANFMEREAWDMYGVNFKGHPDLRRILMYDEFKGHPLRKDYPLQGKQPRVQLRYPEVENTARLMERPDLVQIKKRDTISSSKSAIGGDR